MGLPLGSRAVWTPDALVTKYDGFIRDERDTITDTGTMVLTPAVRGPSFAALTFDQATEANKPIFTAPNLVSVTNDFMTASNAAADWNFLHNGGGFTAWFVGTPDSLNRGHTPCGNVSAIKDRAWYWNITTGGQLITTIGNGTVAIVSEVRSGAYAWSGGIVALVARWSSGNALEIWLDGVRVINATPTGAASASDAARVLSLLTTASSVGGTLQGTCRTLGMAKARISDGEVAKLGDWLHANKAAPAWEETVAHTGYIDDSSTVLKFNGLGHMCKLSDGKYFAVWRKGNTHAGVTDKGTIYGAVSSDAGLTWGAEFEILADATYDLRDPCVMQSSSGRILINFFRYDYAGSTGIVNGCRVIYAASTAGPWTEVAANSTLTSLEAVSGPPIELASGDLLMPVYGKDIGDTYDSSRVLKSTDDGATWAELAVIAETTRDYQEPNLVLLSTGNILALLRSGLGGPSVYSCVSADNGATWSAPSVAFGGIGAPRAILLSGGKLVVNYRPVPDPSRTAIRSSADEGATWGDQTILNVPGINHQYGGWAEASSTEADLMVWWKISNTLARGGLRRVEV